jgi:DHA1 family purine ribonucleoside efflux pump-like MFS transporter
MIGLTMLAVASNLLVAFAPSLLVLLAARLLLGIALGGFWAMAIAVTAHLVPADRLGRGLTVVNAGVPIATAVAVPIGAWLGDIWGWRPVFLLADGAAVLALALQVASLPKIPPSAAGGVRGIGSTLRSGVIWLGLIATLLIYSGHFAGFTYIRPVTASISDIDGAGVAVVLMVFGVMNRFGTLLAGPLADRAPRTDVLLFPSAVGAGMLLMLVAAGSFVGLFSAVVLWGVGFGGVATSLQSWGARVEPGRLEQIGGLLVMVANVAVAAGAIIGGFLIDGSASSAPLLGGVAAIVGGLVITSLPARS